MFVKGPARGPSALGRFRAIKYHGQTVYEVPSTPNRKLARNRVDTLTSPVSNAAAPASASGSTPPSLRIVVDMPDSILRRGVLATLSSLNCDAYVALRPARRHERYDLLVTQNTVYPVTESILVIDPTTSVATLVSAVISISNHPLRQRHSAELSPREIEILVMAARGLSNLDIAEKCFVAPNTVKTHLSRIYRKLNVSDRASAVYTAVSSGIIPASELPQA